MATSRSRPESSPSTSPSAEELAAIVAAVEMAWPRPVVVSRPPAASPWRFSNRWWMPRRSVAAERQRP